MQLEKGDWFEKTNAEWIREKLPFYESVWMRFIGHNGKGSICPMPGLDDARSKERSVFAQAHYTMCIDMYILDGIASDLRNNLVTVEEPNDLIVRYRQFIEIVTFIGHARDMIMLMSKKDLLDNDLQQFYATRSLIMHGTKPPTFVDSDGLLMIPIIASSNEGEGEWSGKQVWDAINIANFKFYSDTCVKLIEDFFAVVNKAHGAIYGLYAEEYNNLQIIEPEQTFYSDLMTTSGNFPTGFDITPSSGSVTS